MQVNTLWLGMVQLIYRQLHVDFCQAIRQKMLF